MIVIQLTGGLGNQMFQYAMGRRIAFLKKVPLKLDLSFFKKNPSRAYKLTHYRINAEIASDKEIIKFRKFGNKRILQQLNSLSEYFKPYEKRGYICERNLQFDCNIQKCKSDVYLEGYWQSEKYFKDIEHQIREDFTLLTPPNHPNAEMADLIQSCESVNLHIRRGDYVSNPVTNAYHGTCSPEYYNRAIHIIEKRVKNPHFFIFSDDPAWVRENMNTGHPTTVVDINGPENDYEDLRLMSLCRHHIIANSSFSWWGAWLSQNREKIVIAPKKWFKKPEINTRDLIPDSWIQI